MGRNSAGTALALLCLCVVPAGAQDAAAVLKRVDRHYNQLVSLRTEFTELYTGLGMVRTETGVLLLKKPGRMRWDYTSPAGKVFVLDGKYAWSYTPGDAQVQRFSAKQVDDLRSPLRFLLGHAQLAKELDQVAVAADHDGFRISGVPKGMANRVKQLVLDTTAEGAITRITVEEIGGESTQFTFAHPEENVALPEDRFHYAPPAGVAVVDGVPPA